MYSTSSLAPLLRLTREKMVYGLPSWVMRCWISTAFPRTDTSIWLNLSGFWTISATVVSKSVIAPAFMTIVRSEEHTSELQSLAYLVCRLLLEKKKVHLHTQP